MDIDRKKFKKYKKSWLFVLDATVEIKYVKIKIYFVPEQFFGQPGGGKGAALPLPPQLMTFCKKKYSTSRIKPSFRFLKSVNIFQETKQNIRLCYDLCPRTLGAPLDLALSQEGARDLT